MNCSLMSHSNGLLANLHHQWKLAICPILSPIATPETIRIADYFNTHSAEHPFGDIFYELRRDNLEYQRLNLTFFISMWFPNTEPEIWISLMMYWCYGFRSIIISEIL